MMTVQFDPDTHTYWAGGNRLPSVTQILKPIMPDYRLADPTVGNAVHRITAAQDRGDAHDFDWDACCDEHVIAVASSVEAYRAWKRQYGPKEWTFIEQPMASPLGFAGTPDRVYWHQVIDIKTGEPERWHGVQLAGYSILLGYGTEAKRQGLYLSADGVFRVRDYQDPADFRVFNELLHVNQWMNR